jgi:hypothetical protein
MRVRLTAVLEAVIVAMIGAVLTPAVAEAQIVEVESGRCLDANALASALDSVREQAPRALDVMVRVLEAETQIHFEIVGGDVVLGERTLGTEGLPCEEVLEATALAMAVAIDASTTARVTEPAAPAPPRVAAPLVVPQATAAGRDVAESQPPDARGSVRLASSFDLGVGIGMQPATSAVASMMLDVALGPVASSSVEPELSVRGGLIVGLPAAPEDGGVEASVIAGRLDACGAIVGEALRARGCLSGILGALLTDGIAGDPRLAIGGRIDGRWMLTRLFGLQTGVDLLANLAPDYVISNASDELDELGPAALVISAGPVVEFF